MPEIQPSSSSIRRSKRPENQDDWEPYRDIITQFYGEMRLKDVMTEVERLYNFKATEKQYKTQLKKWNLDTKYIKSSEYLAMLKAKRRREKENPGQQTRFTLHGRLIEQDAISRFEKRAIRTGLIGHDDSLSDRESVDGLIYESCHDT